MLVFSTAILYQKQYQQVSSFKASCNFFKALLPKIQLPIANTPYIYTQQHPHYYFPKKLTPVRLKHSKDRAINFICLGITLGLTGEVEHVLLITQSGGQILSRAGFLE